MSDWQIPLFNSEIPEPAKKAVLGVLDRNWLSMGGVTHEFEAQFALMHQSKHAVSVTNCTAALHLALLALGIGPGDEVIVPACTFVATANAIRYVGATPVFADVHSLEDLTLSPQEVARRIGPKTKAVLVVHYAGYAADTLALKELCQLHGLFLVEDVAHAPLATDASGKILGTVGDMGCFSFFANKNLSTGEGGMVLTQDDALAEKLRLLRAHGLSSGTFERYQGRAAAQYDVLCLGYNYRIDEMRSALGLAQLRYLAEWNAQRKVHVEQYRQRLQTQPHVIIPFANHQRGQSVYHIFPVILRPDAPQRKTVVSALTQLGIQTSLHYWPIHWFKAYETYAQESLPHSEAVGERLITLPLYPQMTSAQIDQVCDALHSACATTAAFS